MKAVNGWPTSAEGENGLFIGLRAARGTQSLCVQERERETQKAGRLGNETV